ncbi:MAG: hypothetical protein AAF821_13005 [Cyanobacteria bacterium P01_D01_bin.156]
MLLVFYKFLSVVPSHTSAISMTHPFTPLLMLVLAISYLLMVYIAFTAIQRFLRRREQM